MSFDEFSEKLRRIMADHLKAHGRPMATIDELQRYLDRQLARRPRKATLRSLKGILR